MNVHLLLALALAATPPVASDAKPSDAKPAEAKPSQVKPAGPIDERQVLSKALVFLDGKGAELEKGSTCVNCHHAPLRSWALREASQAAIPVDTKALEQVNRDFLKRVIELKDEYRQRQWGHSLSTFFLLAAADSEPLSLPKETADALRQIILAEQTADGSWKPAGQFGNQRRPKKDAIQSQTMWTMLALARLEPQDDATKAAREKGMKWLAATDAGATIDVRALRLVVEGRWGKPEVADALQAKLIESQKPDGGWGWQPDDPSDAWGTALALFALSSTAKSDLTQAVVLDKAIQSARDFLAKTQQENGSWHVTGKLTKNDDMASYFGTAWAIIGLSRTMPKQ